MCYRVYKTSAIPEASAWERCRGSSFNHNRPGQAIEVLAPGQMLIIMLQAYHSWPVKKADSWECVALIKSLLREVCQT